MIARRCNSVGNIKEIGNGNADIGIAVRDMIDTMYRDNKKGRKLALKLFTEGFNKTMGESTILKIREEGRHLNE